MIARRCSAMAADGEARLKRKACLCFSPCLIQFPKMSQCSGKSEASKGVSSVGLDATAEQDDRFGVCPLPQLGDTDIKHPQVYLGIAGRKAERLTDMGFGFRVSTNKILGHADVRVCADTISIQRQRPFAFSDALSHTVRENVDVAQDLVSPGMVRCEGQGFGRRCFSRRETCSPVVAKEVDGALKFN